MHSQLPNTKVQRAMVVNRMLTLVLESASASYFRSEFLCDGQGAVRQVILYVGRSCDFLK